MNVGIWKIQVANIGHKAVKAPTALNVFFNGSFKRSYVTQVIRKWVMHVLKREENKPTTLLENLSSNVCRIC